MGEQTENPKPKKTMLDTIKIKQYRRVLENYDFQNSWKTAKHSKYVTWVCNPKRFEPRPRLTIYQTPERIWHIEAEVSLPKMLFGHNARLPNQSETLEGLRLISNYVESHSGLSFNAENAIVTRVDFAKDLQVSEEKVYQLVKKLSQKTLLRKNKLFYNDTTLYFNSKDKKKSDSVRIYPKLQEVLARKNPISNVVEEAKGMLRFERIFLKNSIQRFAQKNGLNDKSAKSLLTQDISDLVMSETLESLNYDEIEIITDSVLLQLLKLFPPNQAISLFGFLEMIRIYGENFYKNPSLKFSKTTYFTHVQKLKEARVWQIENA